MGNGHIGLRELFAICLGVISFAAAVYMLVPSGQSDAAPASAHDAVQGAGETPPAEEAAARETPVTNMSLIELLNEGLGRGDYRYFREFQLGTLSTETQYWSMGALNESPDAIPPKENDFRAAPILFNGRYIDSLRGFTFRLYQITDRTAPMRLQGSAVFLSNSTPLDSHLINSTTVDIRYGPHPRLAQILDDCHILSAGGMQTPSGSSITVYDFNCTIMYGAIP